MSVALPRVASRPVVVSVQAVGLWLDVAGRVYQSVTVSDLFIAVPP